MKKILKSIFKPKIYLIQSLLIRTGNTKRLSNFLLWQLAYAEIFFEKKLWPDFNEKDYIKIIKNLKKLKEILVIFDVTKFIKKNNHINYFIILLFL